MKNLFFILIIMILLSCSTYSFKTVSGQYGTKGKPSTYLDLIEDSTFLFIWEDKVRSGSTTGKWFVKRNKIVLNSDSIIQSNTLPKFHITKSLKNNSDKITFNLFEPDSIQPLSFVSGLLFYKGEIVDKQRSNLNGRMLFNKQDVDSIKIICPFFEDILLSKVDYDYYKIIATEINFNLYQLFTNKKWRIRKNYLFDRTKNDFYQKKRLYRGN